MIESEIPIAKNMYPGLNIRHCHSFLKTLSVNKTNLGEGAALPCPASTNKLNSRDVTFSTDNYILFTLFSNEV